MEDLKLDYKGKTKDLLSDAEGNTYFYFKDDMTGKDGVFDPGENQVGLTVEGVGKAALETTTFFFEKLNEKNIPTHFIESNIENNLMKAHKAEVFGNGLEVICRFKAYGSFIKRYGEYIESGTDIDKVIEFTLKDDERQDPLINEEALIAIGILKGGEYEIIANLTKQISQEVKEILAEKNLEIYDIKLEFGRLADSEDIVLIDEISGGNMRVFHDGEFIEPLSLGNYLFN